MKINDILSLAVIYGAHRSVGQATIATYAVNDGKRLKYLSDGGGCTLKTYARFMRWFSDNWPRDLEWPPQIPRPPKPEKEAA